MRSRPPVSEEREVDVFDMLEGALRTGMPMAHVLGLHVDQVRRQADVGLLVDGHPGDDVGVAARDPLLVVDREGLYVTRPLTVWGATSRDRHLGQTGPGGWM
jgi:hypothetical protein